MAVRPCLFLGAGLALLVTGGALDLLPSARSTAASATSSFEPTGIVSAIYRAKIKTDSTDWPTPQQQHQYLSKSLADLWAKADAKPPPDGDVGAIDFDFIADTNALTLKSFIVTLEKQNPDAATVAVELIYKEPHVERGKSIVTYEFLNEDGGWKIDNIHTKKWSIRDLLNLWLKDD